MDSTEYDRVVVHLLRRLARMLYRRSRQMMRRCGLTGPQAITLQTLLREGEMSVTALARQTSMSAGTLSGVVDRLALRGLVERAPNTRDRRSIVVRATPEASRWLAEDLSPLNAEFAARFAALPDEEKESILRALRRLALLIGEPSAASPPPVDATDLGTGGSPHRGRVVSNPH
jgi:DNA-binding MarR family transcriptional regulator